MRDRKTNRGHSNRSRLRSSTGSDYELPVIRRKLWERAFSHAGPAAWNGLPTKIRSITDTNIFKSRLKTYLFNIAYDNWNSFVMRRWSQTISLCNTYLNMWSPVFFIRNLDQHFRFQMFKICKIGSFSYVSGSLNYKTRKASVDAAIRRNAICKDTANYSVARSPFCPPSWNL